MNPKVTMIKKSQLLLKLSLLFLVFSVNSYSQNLLQKNEECIYSFKTKKGKTMMLAKDKTNKYIIYRFGTSKKIELEFPKKDSLSWRLFTYNFYLRGGGKQNAGLDIDNIKFESSGYKYVIYSEYSAGDDQNEESYSVGINIYDKNDKLIQIFGVPETEVGSLKDFRTNELLKIDYDSGLED